MKGFFGKGKTRGDETSSPEDFKKGGMYIAGISAVIVVAILLAMNLLSMDLFRGVRGFVQAEGLYSKNQKEATLRLTDYALSGDATDLQEHKRLLDLLYDVREARVMTTRILRWSFCPRRQYPMKINRR